jgi:hypothetical protein
MRPKTYAVRCVAGIYSGYWVNFNGPFEYVKHVDDVQRATLLPGWKACQWAAVLKDYEAVVVG